MVRQSAETDGEVTAVELLRILWRFRIPILAGVTLFTIVAIIYSLTVTPVYRSEALLRPVESMSTGGNSALGSLARQFGGLAAFAGITLAPDVDEALAIIGSRAFNETLLVEDGILYELFDEQWNPETRTWGNGDTGFFGKLRTWISNPPWQRAAGAQSAEDRQSALMLELGLERFNSIRDVSRDRTTNHVRITVDWKDPVLAKEWIELIVERMNEVMRKRAVQEANETLAFLQEKMDEESNAQLVASMGALYQQQLERAMLATVREDYSLQFIDPPYVPELRHSPRRKLIVIGTFLVSTVLMSALTLLYCAWIGFRLRENSK